ncbi:MAG TPA: DUF664 domain-containing protein [Mycobacterium sp.]
MLRELAQHAGHADILREQVLTQRRVKSPASRSNLRPSAPPPPPGH